MAIHAALGYAIGTQGDASYGNDNRAPDREAVNMLRVALLFSGAGTLMPEGQQPASDNGSQATQKRLPPPSPASTGPADHAASMIEIEAEPAEHYYKLSELTQKPFILRDVPQTLPSDLPAIRPQTALVHMLINEHGDIDKVTFDESNLPDEVERFITESFSKASFHPGKINGAAVKSQMRIEIQLEKARPQ